MPEFIEISTCRRVTGPEERDGYIYINPELISAWSYYPKTDDELARTMVYLVGGMPEMAFLGHEAEVVARQLEDKHGS